MLNEDYREMLQILSGNKVKFLVVGAYALGAHGYPRATCDIDIWVKASQANSEKIYRSLAEFGAPVSGISEKTFAEKGIVFQIGVPPRRIDIITHIDGVRFDPAYRAKKVVRMENLLIPFLSKEDLIKNKLRTGRDKDRLDALELKKRC